MENKYYTPSIEEFHYGFEFERNEAHRVYYKPNMPVEYKWVSKKWDEHQIRLGNLKCEIFGKNIRVKYLTVEDIKSLGYSLTKEDNTYKEFLKMGQFYKLHIVICPIFSEDLGVYINIFTNQNTDQTIRFSGFIKNKAELSKLLKQLNIL